MIDPAPVADRGEDATSTSSSGPAPTRTSCSGSSTCWSPRTSCTSAAARASSTGLDEVERLAPDVHARSGRARVRHRRRRRSAASPASSPRTERAGVYGRIGTCTQEFGTLASWLVDVVNVLAGNLDREGGVMFAAARRPAARAPAPRREQGPGRDVRPPPEPGEADCPSSSASSRSPRSPRRSRRRARVRSGR